MDFGCDGAEARVTLCRDLARRKRRANRAIGLVQMPAIGEAAVAEKGMEFRVSMFEFAKRKMREPEFLHAGTIDEIGIRVDVVEPRVVWVRLDRKSAALADYSHHMLL